MRRHRPAHGPAATRLGSRGRYFSNGSVKDLKGVVNFHKAQCSIGLTEPEKTDLVNFLSAL